MSDDRTKVAQHDHERVQADNEADLAHWAQRLHTTPDRLRAAVVDVGDGVGALRRHLDGDAGALPQPMRNSAD
jgi:hypothetical protein